jgi:hypothetical protein
MEYTYWEKEWKQWERKHLGDRWLRERLNALDYCRMIFESNIYSLWHVKRLHDCGHCFPPFFFFISLHSLFPLTLSNTVPGKIYIQVLLANNTHLTNSIMYFFNKYLSFTRESVACINAYLRVIVQLLVHIMSNTQISYVYVDVSFS